MPYCPPIQEECPPTPKTSSTPNILALTETSGKPLSKRSPLSSSQQTLVEENLAAYCEPWGTAVPPAAPRNRDSIASTDSDILPDRHAAAQVPPVMCSTPKSAHPSPGPGHHLLDTIPESEAPPKVPLPLNSASGTGTKRLPPPTLPKPPKSRPQPPPKPKKAADSAEDSFQDETQDGSEV